MSLEEQLKNLDPNQLSWLFMLLRKVLIRGTSDVFEIARMGDIPFNCIEQAVSDNFTEERKIEVAKQFADYKRSVESHIDKVISNNRPYINRDIQIQIYFNCPPFTKELFEISEISQK